MGVFLSVYLSRVKSLRLPHVRGGVSSDSSVSRSFKTSSPRPWGCFQPVFATSSITWSSPRPWGCFQYQEVSISPGRVFPTSVGVFLEVDVSKLFGSGLPHVRGGVSSDSSVSRSFKTSSPRPWGCFQPVFATSSITWSSPRPWGCFQYQEVSISPGRVFPTSVGVFLEVDVSKLFGSGLPHVRGGVSFDWRPADIVQQSSPRPWGCFWAIEHGESLRYVFPTSVGVFPTRFRHIKHHLVFPTSVGVFPISRS